MWIEGGETGTVRIDRERQKEIGTAKTDRDRKIEDR